MESTLGKKPCSETIPSGEEKELAQILSLTKMQSQNGQEWKQDIILSKHDLLSDDGKTGISTNNNQI